MLNTDDVVDLAAVEGVVLVNEAVLAERIRSLRDDAPKRGIDVSAHERWL